MQQFDKVQAIFKPKIETLDPQAFPYIGKELTFEALWFISEEDGGPYVGQWAFRPVGSDGGWLFPGWIPEEDLEII